MTVEESVLCSNAGGKPGGRDEAPVTVTPMRNRGQFGEGSGQATLQRVGSRFETWHQSCQVLFALEGLATKGAASAA